MLGAAGACGGAFAFVATDTLTLLGVNLIANPIGLAIFGTGLLIVAIATPFAVQRTWKNEVWNHELDYLHAENADTVELLINVTNTTSSALALRGLGVNQNDKINGKQTTDFDVLKNKESSLTLIEPPNTCSFSQLSKLVEKEVIQSYWKEQAGYGVLRKETRKNAVYELKSLMKGLKLNPIE